MFDTRFSGSTADPLGGLLDLSSAPVCFGYYEQNASDAETIARCHDQTRVGPVGWWNRHRRLGIGVGMTLVTSLGFLPAVQNAILMGLT
ncbi:hypothetical protein ABZ942_16625 [Nocardia sp. NPDC046473]|uniref:hypothetical protein n=1 Tax=Nocardia sp. NPDC046473 TaxID=3155733 RepID=UPI0033ED983A